MNAFREAVLQPLLLDLRGRPCLVAGGGSTAAKRARTLVAAGAKVKVVAPVLGEALREMARKGEVEWEERGFREEDLEGRFLVVAVTGDAAVNAEIERSCRRRGILVCANAPHSHGDVLFPSVVRRGDLVLAVSTSGGNPALSRMIREGLESSLDPGLTELVSVVNEARRKLKSSGLRPSFRDWREALDEEFFQLMENGLRHEAERLLLDRLSRTSPERPEFLVWGISHRTACLEVKERLSRQGAELEGLLRELKKTLERVMVLDTCNRFEVYAYAQPSLLREAVSAVVLPGLAGFEEGGHYTPYLLRGEEALAHLIRVICGLDSMIPGEQQIRNQVRKAARLADSVGALGDPLRGVLERAVRAGRRVASNLGAVAEWRSVSGAAVMEVRRHLGDLEGRTVLVVGSGEAGRLALHLLRREGAAKLRLMGSDAERVEGLARRFGAEPLHYQDLKAALCDADAVINSSPRPSSILEREDLLKAGEKRGDHPLLILDISVPRGFPAWCSELEGVVYRDLRDLGDWGGGDLDPRTEVEALLEGEARRIAAWLEERAVSPLIARLHREAEDIGRRAADEIASALRLEDGQREYLGRSIHRLVRRVLHRQTLIARTFPATTGLASSRGEAAGDA